MKLLKNIIIFSSIISASAFAATPGFFAGISAGYSNTQMDSATAPIELVFIDGPVRERLITTGTLVKNGNYKFAYGVQLGYNFNPYVGLQLAYNKYGNTNFDIKTKILTPTGKPLAFKNIGYSSFYDVDVMVNGYLPLSNHFELIGQLGMAYVKGKLNARDQNGFMINPNDSKPVSTLNFKTAYRPKAAIGLSYAVAQGMNLTLSYSRIFKSGNLQKSIYSVSKDNNSKVKYTPNLDMLSLSFNYSFGANNN